MKPAWIRAVRDECADLGIAFFMKQIGSNHDGWPMNIRSKGDDMDDWLSTACDAIIWPDLGRRASLPKSWEACDVTLRFWVDVAYEHIKSDHIELTKRQLVAQILHQY
jgi:hypothetical protein